MIHYAAMPLQKVGVPTYGILTQPEHIYLREEVYEWLLLNSPSYEGWDVKQIDEGEFEVWLKFSDLNEATVFKLTFA